MTRSLRNKIRQQDSLIQAPRSGRWSPIQYCFDEDAGEFFNIGVAFTDGFRVEVRMMDTFDRLRCLFDTRISPHDLHHIFVDIEDTLVEIGPELPSTLGRNVRLGEPLYASGEDSESIVDEFFNDIVTLARPKNSNIVRFRYQSNHKVLETITNHMKESRPLLADRLIQKERYVLKLNTGNKIDLDIPLIGSEAAGTVVSAWFKSPLVVENSLLGASADLNLMRSNSERKKASIAVLIPDDDSGLTKTELDRLLRTTRKQLDKIDAAGIEVIEANKSVDLARMTADWWFKQAV